jgi:CheY-like chemotaxis protein
MKIVLLKTNLEKRGHRVRLDSQAGLVQHLKQDLPDLVLLDINLPRTDGGDICSGLKADPRTRDTTVILISGIMELRQISQLCGADDYLIKPFEMSAFDSLISRWETRN